MWFTLARSNTYSPLPARFAPGVRAACCCDMFVSSILSAFRSASSLFEPEDARLRTIASGERPRRRSLEQCPRPSAENGGLISGRNRQAANLRHALRHPHVEGVIAAEQHALGAGIAHEKRERLLRVHDGIEIEALERLRRRFGELALGFRAHV